MVSEEVGIPSRRRALGTNGQLATYVVCLLAAVGPMKYASEDNKSYISQTDRNPPF